MNLKSFISLAISLGLTLFCTGCSNTPKSTAKNNNNSSVSFTTKENKDDSTKETYPKPDWETQIYKGKYLKYEIPKNWSKNEAHSIEEINLDFFTSTDTTSEMPSNINIQISNLQSNSKNIDYSDEKIKEDFHKFLLSSGQLPEEAQSGKYFTEEINGIWVYYLTFVRKMIYLQNRLYIFQWDLIILLSFGLLILMMVLLQKLTISQNISVLH